MLQKEQGSSPLEFTRPSAAIRSAEAWDPRTVITPSRWHRFHLHVIKAKTGTEGASHHRKLTQLVRHGARTGTGQSGVGVVMPGLVNKGTGTKSLLRIQEGQ